MDVAKSASLYKSELTIRSSVSQGRQWSPVCPCSADSTPCSRHSLGGCPSLPGPCLSPAPAGRTPGLCVCVHVCVCLCVCVCTCVHVCIHNQCVHMHKSLLQWCSTHSQTTLCFAKIHYKSKQLNPFTPSRVRIERVKKDVSTALT